MANPGIVNFILGTTPADREDLATRVAAAFPSAGSGDIRSAYELARRKVRQAEAELTRHERDQPELVARARTRHAALLAAMDGQR